MRPRYWHTRLLLLSFLPFNSKTVRHPWAFHRLSCVCALVSRTDRGKRIEDHAERRIGATKSDGESSHFRTSLVGIVRMPPRCFSKPDQKPRLGFSYVRQMTFLMLHGSNPTVMVTPQYNQLRGLS